MLKCFRYRVLKTFSLYKEKSISEPYKIINGVMRHQKWGYRSRYMRVSLFKKNARYFDYESHETEQGSITHSLKEMGYLEHISTINGFPK